MSEPCKFENRIIDMSECIATCVEAITDIKKHVEAGLLWRLTIAGVTFSLFASIVSFAYFYGGLSRSVENLNKIVEHHYLSDRQNGNNGALNGHYQDNKRG